MKGGKCVGIVKSRAPGPLLRRAGRAVVTGGTPDGAAPVAVPHEHFHGGLQDPWKPSKGIPMRALPARRIALGALCAALLAGVTGPAAMAADTRPTPTEPLA